MDTDAREGRRRKGLKRPEQVAANRRLLLDAAGRVFRDLGYTGASLDAIAEAAGFTKGAVYSHFTSKADLFLKLLEERIERRIASQLTAASTALGAGDLRQVFLDVFMTSRSDSRWQLALLEF